MSYPIWIIKYNENYEMKIVTRLIGFPTHTDRKKWNGHMTAQVFFRKQQSM
jgi:hypothetical protein